MYESAFKNCTSLVSFDHKATNTLWVYDHGFDGCTKLASISGYNLHAGNYAVANCTGLEQLSIVAFAGSGTTRKGIGEYAFLNCSALTSKINYQFETAGGTGTYRYTIGDYAFKNCSSLTEIALPNNTISVGAAILSGCSSLQKLTIPYIGKDSAAPDYERGYYSNSSQKDYFIHYYFGTESYSGSYKSTNWGIGYYIPTGLKEVEITNCASNIVAYAFYRVNSITTVSITGVMNDSYNISGFAFSGTNLSTINLADNLVEIDLGAFKNLKMSSVVLPDSVTYIGENAFASCSSLTDVTLPSNEDLVISAYAFSYTIISEIEFNKFKSIGTQAFANNIKLVSVSFNYGTNGSTFGTIGEKAFYGCSNENLVINYYGTKAQLTAIISNGNLTSGWNIIKDADGSTPAVVKNTISCSDGLLTIN